MFSRVVYGLVDADLHEPVDVYSRWIDAAEEDNEGIGADGAPESSGQQAGDGQGVQDADE